MDNERIRIVRADAIDFLQSLPPGSASLVFGSPPYEKARLYLEDGEDLGVARDTETWVAWMVEVFKASLRACNGLVAFVVEGQTSDYKYSCGPALLMADLHRADINLRKPLIFHRVGIPGSGGPDWLRNDWEWIICATNGGRLPWSDNTAMGDTPKYGPGGEMSNRTQNGSRVNAFGMTGTVDGQSGHKARKRQGYFRHSEDKTTVKGASGHDRDICAIANPGNAVERTYTTSEVREMLELESDYIHCAVGGGHMGESGQFAADNEAPFPEDLPEFFVKSFCQPDGLVVDPFLGSGTTGAVAVRHGRRFAGCDIRQSQVDLATRRLAVETPMSLFKEE